MKKTIHPSTQKIVFQDIITGEGFLIESAAQTAETIVWSDGETYPLVKVEISSSSHSAFNGATETEVRSTRRETFEKKYSKKEALN